MKKLIAALCALIFLKSATTNVFATPSLFNNYADTIKPQPRTPVQDSTTAEDTTAFAADTSSALKTIKVKGYYRKDGKYVAPYTRRAPSKKH